MFSSLEVLALSLTTPFMTVRSASHAAPTLNYE
jgi:hypothetical protein